MVKQDILKAVYYAQQKPDGMNTSMKIAPTG